MRGAKGQEGAASPAGVSIQVGSKPSVSFDRLHQHTNRQILTDPVIIAIADIISQYGQKKGMSSIDLKSNSETIISNFSDLGASAPRQNFIRALLTIYNFHQKIYQQIKDNVNRISHRDTLRMDIVDQSQELLKVRLLVENALSALKSSCEQFFKAITFIASNGNDKVSIITLPSLTIESAEQITLRLTGIQPSPVEAYTSSTDFFQVIKALQSKAKFNDTTNLMRFILSVKTVINSQLDEQERALREATQPTATGHVTQEEHAALTAKLDAALKASRDQLQQGKEHEILAQQAAQRAGRAESKLDDLQAKFDALQAEKHAGDLRLQQALGEVERHKSTAADAISRADKLQSQLVLSTAEAAEVPILKRQADEAGRMHEGSMQAAQQQLIALTKLIDQLKSPKLLGNVYLLITATFNLFMEKNRRTDKRLLDPKRESIENLTLLIRGINNTKSKSDAVNTILLSDPLHNAFNALLAQLKTLRQEGINVDMYHDIFGINAKLYDEKAHEPLPQWMLALLRLDRDRSTDRRITLMDLVKCFADLFKDGLPKSVSCPRGHELEGTPFNSRKREFAKSMKYLLKFATPSLGKAATKGSREIEDNIEQNFYRIFSIMDPVMETSEEAPPASASPAPPPSIYD